MKLKGVVLLEGPDGAGKTTLGRHLCDKYDGLYVHRTWWKGIDVWEHHTEAVRIAFENAHEKLVVIDRLWPSEAVYGRVYRGESDYKANSRCMDRVLQRLAAVTVACVPGELGYVESKHAERAAAGGEMYDTVDEVWRAYRDWAHGSSSRPIDGDIVEQQSAQGGVLRRRPLDTVLYDVTRHQGRLTGPRLEVAHAVRESQRAQWPFALDPTTPNVLGHRSTATYLFVGEQVGNLHSWSRFPFYARTHSPDFLNRALHEARFDESRGAWTNAWDEDNRLPAIYAASPHLRIVALGRAAERRCRQVGVPVHAALPHPSWERRFNHHGQRGTPYAELLKQALET